MARFRYRAYDEKGNVIEREVVYPSQEVLLSELQSQGIYVVELEVLEEEEKKKEEKPSFSFRRRVSDRDISIFCRQLGTMVQAGVPLVEALNVIAEQMPDRRLSEASQEVARMISEGMSVSAAMRKFPHVFPELVVNLMLVGEETGKIDVALLKASEYYEKMATIKGKIKSASFYPTFVVIVAVTIVSGILYFLVPTFAQIYSSLGGELPLPTQMLIAASNALRNNLPLILIFLIGSALVFRYLYTTNYGFRRSVHAFMLRIPKMGSLFQKSAMAQFARTMATLFSSGVALERSFEISKQVVGNTIIKEALEAAGKGVVEGQPMYRALEKTGVFPKLVVAMVRVGEDTGKLDQMLETIARFYEDEVDRTVDGLIKLIEPMLIVFIGGAVGLILIALYMPIFKLGELIK
ncbi:Type II secretion system F domain protein [Thermocrinis albus DSM 14484]|uniref:Type II secretion system F domain protein n=1 Tax=Thermocrinis albus (strain DSM 14484 / JCM 11386 / HI 11/12) TaxID=638303 RepID=D3SLP2_THEAH|nr:type II secretion system F family protein [Thermocrinis albus]ADC89672.1 Type II secretion system F domain protein [Thermocrinis albus DSM 14484]